MKSSFRDWIIKESKDYIFINKPYLVASLNERTADRQSILELAREYHPEAQLCHRLDKETTGVMAIARHPAAYKHLSDLFTDRKVNKIYHALISGTRFLENYEVDLPILPLKNGTVVIDKVEGKPSKTIFSTLKVYRDHTLLECRPLTGRMHQIRIHLACMDAPIVADHQYGGQDIWLSKLKKKFKLKKETEEQPLMKRTALHARELRFVGPEGEEISVEAPYHKDFETTIRQLEKNI